MRHFVGHPLILFSESLAASPNFASATSAILLLAKLYFHLGDYDRSVMFALKAGTLFNIEERSQFAETILAAIIDQYITLRCSDSPNGETDTFENIINRVVERCLRDQEFEQVDTIESFPIPYLMFF